jgi:hypothetical protein
VNDQALDGVIHVQPCHGFHIMEGFSLQLNSSDGQSRVSVYPLRSSHFPIKQSLSSKEICKNNDENI